MNNVNVKTEYLFLKKGVCIATDYETKLHGHVKETFSWAKNINPRSPFVYVSYLTLVFIFVQHTKHLVCSVNHVEVASNILTILKTKTTYGREEWVNQKQTWNFVAVANYPW